MIRKFLLYYHLSPALSSRATIPLRRRTRHVGLLLALFIVKEAFAAVTGLWGIRRARVVKGAEWHGKLTTVAIYTMILVHLIWADIPPAVSTILVGVCMGIMLMSLVLYAIRNIKMIRGKS